MVITQKRPIKNNSVLSKYFTYSNCLILIFFIVSFIGILNHEMWRDETQAWLLARDSSTIIDLYQNLKYEGHPGLWHLCLFFIAKFTHNPFSMQLFHILISTASVYIFVKLSPFNIIEKTLFTFSYFSLFEYNLISRNYNLGLLLVFMFCYLFTSQNRNYILTFLSLALLANTNIYGLIICLCLSLTLIIDTVRLYKIGQYQPDSKRARNLTIGLIILFLGIGLSIFQLFPAAVQDTAKDIQQNIGEQTVVSRFDFIFIMLKRLGYAIRAIWYSYVPIPDFFEYHFWSHNIVRNNYFLILFASLVSLFLIFFSTLIFINKPLALFFYLSATSGILIFTWLKFQGTLRHHGNLFIIFLASIWISRCFKESYNIPKLFHIHKITSYCKKNHKRVITIILVIQMISGIYAYSMDLIHPFSKSKVAANYIKKERLNESFILADKNTIVSPISAYANLKIYYLAYDKLGSFFDNPQTKFIKNQSELIDKIKLEIQDSKIKNILILSYPLKIQTNDLKFTKLKYFDNSIVGEERYYIYAVERNNN
ncbi:hypothetical protein NIES267_64920 [Calothrix parasitica NIES-267]|uniref:Glycosyltransferase RgtA/B/C/D-like domain-containing protein n=1 Tax=Calothrix parasitica NIES-267 TaxID=1973488 RepID=A0A1Z4M0P5_9CYAN|nr:hypothetical protein NIES267_64920 [Calothrix parasitica NIES-267]